MTVRQATPSMGFDVDQVLSNEQAAVFKANGYDFCLRYIPRQLDTFRYNLTNPEMLRILAAGLSLMVVQHCPEPNWQPTADLGKQYGEYGAGYCEKTLQLPKGASVWLDLEMVKPATPIADTISYATEWYNAIKAAGYNPGLYCGFQTGLAPSELYRNLPFKSYWRAYNGPDVATRGFQMIQEPEQILDGISFDPNRCQPDQLGDTAFWLSTD
jgi:Domain of unknown function (DUF1906)